jgi:hypothetical protein
MTKRIPAASVLAFIASIASSITDAQQTATSISTVTERGCVSQLNPTEIVLRHTVGCETRDCCLACPGPPDLRLRVGNDIDALLLSFRNLSPEQRKSVKTSGGATWEKDGRLRVPPGVSVVQGLTANASGAWPTATVSVVPKDWRPQAIAQRRQTSVARPWARVGSATRPLKFSVESIQGGTILDSQFVNVSLGPCHQTPPPPGGDLTCPLAVADVGQNAVQFFGHLSGTNLVEPPRSIGSAAGIRQPIGLGFDGSGNLYVQDVDAVNVYKADPFGTFVLARTIRGDLTELSTGVSIGHSGFAVDSGGWVYVASVTQDFRGIVAVFDPTQEGNVSPNHVIVLPATYPYTTDPMSIAVSRAGDRVAVLGWPGAITLGSETDIFVFSNGSLQQQLAVPDFSVSIALDREARLYVLAASSSGPPFHPWLIWVYELDSSGLYREARSFTSTDLNRCDTAFDCTLTVDLSEQVYVAGGPFQGASGFVLAFPARSTGPTAPFASLLGQTGQLFQEPSAVACPTN